MFHDNRILILFKSPLKQFNTMEYLIKGRHRVFQPERRQGRRRLVRIARAGGERTAEVHGQVFSIAQWVLRSLPHFFAPWFFGVGRSWKYRTASVQVAWGMGKDSGIGSNHGCKDSEEKNQLSVAGKGSGRMGRCHLNVKHYLSPFVPFSLAEYEDIKCETLTGFGCPEDQLWLTEVQTVEEFTQFYRNQSPDPLGFYNLHGYHYATRFTIMKAEKCSLLRDSTPTRSLPRHAEQLRTI